MSHPLSRIATAIACATLLSSCGGGDDGPADARNGTYTAYATNGERFTLGLDFDTSHVAFQRATAGSPFVESSFSADAVAGTYVFQSQAGAGKTARFRYLDDLVVGGYNFNGSVRPFVASRRFAQTFADAAGTYNNLGVAQTAAGAVITEIRISRIGADGTLQICEDLITYTIANCPAASVRNHTLSIAGDTFTATPVPAGAGTPFSFRVARAGAEKIYLMADAAGDGAQTFRIGVAESPVFRSGFDWGATVQGTWARADYTAVNYSSEGVAVDGSANNYLGAMTGLGAGAPQGIRSYDFENAFVVQNTQLTVLAGTFRGRSAGFMQIGIR